MLYSLLFSLQRHQKSAILFALDLLWLALVFALFLTFSATSPPVSLAEAMGLLAVMLSVAAGILKFTGLHRVQLNHYQSRSILITFAIGLLSACAGFILSQVLNLGLSPALFSQGLMAFVLLSIGAKMLLREIVVATYRRRHGAFRVLIYGAGQTGQQLAAALQNNQSFFPLGFLDDERSLHGAMILGLRVFPVRDLEHRVEAMEVDRIILAMPSLSDVEKAAIAERLGHLPCEVHSMPSFASILIEPERVVETQPLDFARLLGRSHLEADLPGTRQMYMEKAILVTGAGGSIGSELCLQIAASRPRELLLLDHSEIALYHIHRKLNQRYPDVAVTPVLGSVCEPSLVRHLFSSNRIDVVVHAAAYKHLPVLESNIIEGMRNNVLGTRVVATAAKAHGAESFILVSTDKAVRPTSWLGYSKRFAEMIVQDMATRSTETRLSMVRFGNVLGSSGSVIPLFQEQIARGGPVTLTHQDVTRYFMTVSEAVRLVLLAGSFARGGDVFVLDMGDPVPIRDLARNLIEASGYTVRDPANPEGDIELLITGLRSGEKMQEELLIGSDLLTTMHPKILRATELHPSEIEMANLLVEITAAIDAYDENALHNVVDRFAVFLGKDASEKDGNMLRKRQPS